MSQEAVEDPTDQTVHDPVCHMDIVASNSAGSLEHRGFTYYFCSEDCLQSFEADPEGVLSAEREHQH